jgi:hypothetical protein
MSMHLNDETTDLGHTKVVDASGLDFLTQQGWRLVAIVAETYTETTFVPMTESELRTATREASHFTVYNARPRDSDALFVPPGMKAHVVPCVRHQYLVARHGDQVVRDLTERLEAATGATRAAEEDAHTTKRELDETHRVLAQEREAHQATACQVDRLGGQLIASREDRSRLAQSRRQYEVDLAKLRKALGDRQIDDILKGDKKSDG